MAYVESVGRGLFPLCYCIHDCISLFYLCEHNFYMELLIRTFYIYDTDGWGKFNVDVLFLVLGNFAFVGTNIIRYRETIIRHHFPV